MEKRRTNFELRELVFNELMRESCKSYWRRGVRQYAIGLLSGLDLLAVEKSTLHSALLNGASDWSEYSYGGCALISDRDIAARLPCRRCNLIYRLTYRPYGEKGVNHANKHHRNSLAHGCATSSRRNRHSGMRPHPL